MFAQLNIYKNMIIGGVIIVLITGLYFYIHTLKSQINNLQDLLKDNQIELANSKLQSERYKNALDSQNKEIESLKLNEKLSLAKLKKWKSLPPKIKYKTITKIREVKSDECKDIKNVLNAVKLINPNIL